MGSLIRWLTFKIKPANCGYETPCLLWLGTLNDKGYPMVKQDGRMVRVHRLVYEQANGELPEGYDVHHKCEVKNCINIEHLEQINKEDHGRLSVPAPVACPQGHPYTGSNLGWNRGSRRCLQCHREREARRRAA